MTDKDKVQMIVFLAVEVTAVIGCIVYFIVKSGESLQ